MRARTAAASLSAAALAGGLTLGVTAPAQALKPVDPGNPSSVGALCQAARAASVTGTPPSLVPGKPGLRCGQVFGNGGTDIEEPVVEEPTTEEPVVEEPTTEEPVVEEPVTEEPVSEEPAEAPVSAQSYADDDSDEYEKDSEEYEKDSDEYESDDDSDEAEEYESDDDSERAQAYGHRGNSHGASHRAHGRDHGASKGNSHQH